MHRIVAADRERARRACDAGAPAELAATATPSPVNSTALGTDTRPALYIGLGNNEAAVCTFDGLSRMASVLSLNDSVENAALFFSWLQPYQTCADVCPTQLKFLVGATCCVAEASKDFAGSVNVKKDGDTMWKYAAATTDGDGARDAYGGFTVTVHDGLANGQQTFMTNALLDAGLVELLEKEPTVPGPMFVLTTNQSAAFTAVHNRRVPEDAATKMMREIFELFPATHVVRCLMLLNLSNKDWIAAEVFVPAGKVVVFESSAGS